MDTTAFNQQHYGKIIKEARLKNNLLQGQLAEKLGVSPNMIGHWESGRARPDLNLIPALCKTLGISFELFFTGKGKTSDLSYEEQQLIKTFRALPEADRAVLAFTAGKMIETRTETLRQRCLNEYRRIFLNDQTAAAGSGTTLEDTTGESVYVKKNRMSSRAREIIRVNGDSMLPMFENGQLVYVEETANLHEGEIGVFVVNGSGYIKEYQGDHLHSINPDYEDVRFSDEDDIRCYGRVLGIAEAEDFPSEEELRMLSLIEEESRGERR